MKTIVYMSVILLAAASAHPSRRAGMAESGAEIVTGRTNVSKAAVPAAAK